MNTLTKITLEAMISAPGPRHLARELAANALLRGLDTETFAAEIRAAFAAKTYRTPRSLAETELLTSALSEIDWIHLARVLLSTASAPSSDASLPTPESVTRGGKSLN